MKIIKVDHDFEQFEHSDFLVCVKCSNLVLNPMLTNGKIVKTDRYLTSIRKYESAKCRT